MSNFAQIVTLCGVFHFVKILGITNADEESLCSKQEWGEQMYKIMCIFQAYYCKYIYVYKYVFLHIYIYIYILFIYLQCWKSNPGPWTC
jgi:hypothetical protein